MALLHSVHVLSFWLVALVVLVAAAYGWTLRRRRSPTTLPPGPPSLPLVGNLPHIPLTNPWFVFTEWKHEFGDFVGLHGLGNSITILNSIDAITDLFDKRASNYSHRPTYTVVGELMGLDNSMPLMSYNDKWRFQRKLTRNALSPSAVRTYHTVQENLAIILVDAIIKHPSQFVDLIRLTAGRIIMSVTYGLGVDTADHDYITHAEATMEMIGKATMPGAYIADLFPILKRLPSWIPFVTFHEEAKAGRQMIEQLITKPFEHVLSQMATGDAAPSFTKHLLEEELSEKTISKDQYQEAVKWAAGALYGAGGESTYATVLVFFICMVQHPETQRTAQAEIDRVISDRLPKISDRGSLPYVEAIIKEVMRWRPALPLSIPRRTEKDDVYGNIWIPAGSTVIPNVWAVSQDCRSQYPPSEFIPERFLSDNPPLDPGTYSFGFGRRICPGKHLAENSLFIIITTILSCCIISPAKDQTGKEQLLSPSFTTGLVSYPQPFPCEIRPRSEKQMEMLLRSIDSITEHESIHGSE